MHKIACTYHVYFKLELDGLTSSNVSCFV